MFIWYGKPIIFRNGKLSLRNSKVLSQAAYVICFKIIIVPRVFSVIRIIWNIILHIIAKVSQPNNKELMPRESVFPLSSQYFWYTRNGERKKAILQESHFNIFCGFFIYFQNKIWF